MIIKEKKKNMVADIKAEMIESQALSMDEGVAKRILSPLLKPLFDHPTPPHMSS
jgi:glucan biosynthesis protein